MRGKPHLSDGDRPKRLWLDAVAAQVMQRLAAHKLAADLVMVVATLLQQQHLSACCGKTQRQRRAGKSTADDDRCLPLRHPTLLSTSRRKGAQARTAQS